MKILFFLLFNGSLLLSAGQTDLLNQTDSTGKKHGKWVVYLNGYWKEVKDSTQADYYKYTYYEHGVNPYPMGPRDKNWKLIYTGKDTSAKEKIKLLDGEYKWIDEKGITRGVDVFKNGEYISYKWYYPSGELNQIFDYTKKWKEELHTYIIYEYEKRGNVKYYVNRNGVNGWRFYPCSKGDL